MFWFLSLFILLVAGLISLSPLLTRGSAWKFPALFVIILLPLAAYMMYQGVGTPGAMDAPAPAAEHAAATGGDMSDLTMQLRNRLTETPEDAEGWVLLGRSYKTLQRYPEALEAIATANRLMPDQPLIEVELIEARLFASGDPQISKEMVASLEKAVGADPTLQKGLWLLGIAAAQDGDDERAIEWWKQLLEQLEPGSPIEQSVRGQMSEAMERLGQTPAEILAQMPVQTPVQTPPSEPPPQTLVEPPDQTPVETLAETPAEGWLGTGINIELSPSADLAELQKTAGAVLFVIIRPEGQNAGPPLGVRRINRPAFPLHLTLNDKDSMMPQRPISDNRNLQVQARLSVSGQATASAGDWQSNVTTFSTESADSIVLLLDQVLE